MTGDDVTEILAGVVPLGQAPTPRELELAEAVAKQIAERSSKQPEEGES